MFTTPIHPFIPASDRSETVAATYVIKYRPSKPYRHPKLDTSITKHRTVSEAKIMHKLHQLGLRVPELIAVDAPKGVIWMHYVGTQLESGEVSSLKNWLWHLEKTRSAEGHCEDEAVQRLMVNVGREIGSLHMHEIVHGDLTTSNIMLERKEGQWLPVLIDFGLGSHSGLPEDRAVDLYVLERALLSTHLTFSERYNQWLLEGYAEVHAEKGKAELKKANETLRRLEDVRQRGRKRSLLG